MFHDGGVVEVGDGFQHFHAHAADCGYPRPGAVPPATGAPRARPQGQEAPLAGRLATATAIACGDRADRDDAAVGVDLDLYLASKSPRRAALLTPLRSKGTGQQRKRALQTARRSAERGG